MKQLDWEHGSFALYVHWPFCKAKCPYCDFNSHVRQRIDQDDWQQAYLAELARAAAETPGRTLRSVFFGGGTPSLMDPALVSAVLDSVGRHWRLANDVEVTLEANPTSAEASRFAGFRAAGVNRVSLGLQALDDADLRRLGRQHSAADGLAAFDMARGMFDRVSADLIYARQHQTLDQWQAELTHVLSLSPDHLSLYQLTIEEGTAFGDLFQKGKLHGLPDEDTAAGMYEATAAICADHGLSAYEVSNYARPGAESQHNLVYWRMGDYVGLGPGAHGRLTLDGQRWATSTIRSPEAWLQAVRDKGHGEAPREAISAEDQATEYLLMSLRLAEGSSISRFESLASASLNARGLAAALEHGLAVVSEDRIIATPAGRLVLNKLALELLP